jgi:hypothetical protein
VVADVIIIMKKDFNRVTCVYLNPSLFSKQEMKGLKGKRNVLTFFMCSIPLIRTDLVINTVL